LIFSSSPSSAVPNINPGGAVTSSSAVSTSITNVNSDNDSTAINSGGSCTRISSTGLTPAREYAFIDCSEVYLSGKRTSGIYEIW